MRRSKGRCIWLAFATWCVVSGCVALAQTEPAAVVDISLEDMTAGMTADEDLTVTWAWKLAGEDAAGQTLLDAAMRGDNLILLLGKDRYMTVWCFDSDGDAIWHTVLPPEIAGAQVALAIDDNEQILVAATAQRDALAIAGEIANEAYLATLDGAGNIVSQVRVLPSFYLSPRLAGTIGLSLEVTDVQWDVEGDLYLAGALWVPHGDGKYAAPFLAKVDDEGDTFFLALFFEEQGAVVGDFVEAREFEFELEFAAEGEHVHGE